MMHVGLIESRLLTYQPQTIFEQENALKEIAQEIALSALARTDFFRDAAFQSGTCLRILYGLERFSEDLDFVLIEPDKNFDWNKYIIYLQEEFNAYGFNLQINNRTKLDAAIKTAFLKADSQGGLLILKDIKTNKIRMKIKLEIDTNPPAGSQYEIKFLDFPLPFSIQTQDLPSLFASKCDALLCRENVNGRDWFDFIWYVARSIQINFDLLQHAILQASPWQGKKIQVTKSWVIQQLTKKIKIINWQSAKEDVARFLRPRELETLKLWSQDFFLSRVEKLEKYLK